MAGWNVVPPAVLRALLGTTLGIAEQLHVSERTAKRLGASLLRRLRVASRTEAAVLAGAIGLLDEDEARGA